MPEPRIVPPNDSEPMHPTACHYGCGATEDLRPYGPAGEPVCFACATATPERDAVTQRSMGAVMNAAEAMSPDGLIVLDEHGFHPGNLDRLRSR